MKNIAPFYKPVAFDKDDDAWNVCFLKTIL